MRQTAELRVLGTRGCYDDFMAGLCVFDWYFYTLSLKDVARLGYPARLTMARILARQAKGSRRRMKHQREKRH